jgi:hypothetical protein
MICLQIGRAGREGRLRERARVLKKVEIQFQHLAIGCANKSFEPADRASKKRVEKFLTTLPSDKENIFSEES